jgi:hypothetical protein
LRKDGVSLLIQVLEFVFRLMNQYMLVTKDETKKITKEYSILDDYIKTKKSKNKKVKLDDEDFWGPGGFWGEEGFWGKDKPKKNKTNKNLRESLIDKLIQEKKKNTSEPNNINVENLELKDFSRKSRYSSKNKKVSEAPEND